MAGGAFVAQGGRHYEGGVTVFVVVTCMVAAMGGLIFGYDLGISGILFFFFLFPSKLSNQKDITKIHIACLSRVHGVIPKTLYELWFQIRYHLKTV